MMELLIKHDLSFDTNLAKKALEELTAFCPFHNKTSQICLTHTEKTLESAIPSLRWYEGAGGMKDDLAHQFGIEKLTVKKCLAIEEEFKYFNKDFESSYFYKIYKDVQEWSPLKIGRMRLMNCVPRHCYSFHVDYNIRYHFVIITNPDCFFVFDGDRVVRVPEDGHIYSMDATIKHTFVNAGPADRIHIVFDTYEV